MGVTGCRAEVMNSCPLGAHQQIGDAAFANIVATKHRDLRRASRLTTQHVPNQRIDHESVGRQPAASLRPEQRHRERSPSGRIEQASGSIAVDQPVKGIGCC